MSNIVVLTGSPRKNGNSFAMADSFITAAKNNGCNVVRFDTAFMNIGGCRACDACFSKGGACIFDDDFNEIAKAIESADVIVFVTPVYWYSFPSQLKAVIDKFYSYFVAEKDWDGKKTALISCCEEDITTFDSVLMEFNKSMELLKAPSVANVLVPNCCEIGAINKTDGVARAAELAEKF